MAKEAINWVDGETAVKMLFNSYCYKVLKTYTRDPKRKKLPIATRKLGKQILFSGADIQTFLKNQGDKKTA